MAARTANAAPWPQMMAAHTRAHPVMATSLGLGLLALVSLWLQAHLEPATVADDFTRWALWGGATGLAVAMSLRAIGTPAWKAVGVAGLGGLLEPLGAWIGVSLVGGSALAYPVGLGLAAGAMLFVVSHEVIPETHRNGHQTAATLGLMAGFALMMVRDTSLG